MFESSDYFWTLYKELYFKVQRERWVKRESHTFYPVLRYLRWDYWVCHQGLSQKPFPALLQILPGTRALQKRKDHPLQKFNKKRSVITPTLPLRTTPSGRYRTGCIKPAGILTHLEINGNWESTYNHLQLRSWNVLCLLSYRGWGSDPEQMRST